MWGGRDIERDIVLDRRGNREIEGQKASERRTEGYSDGGREWKG